MSAIEDVSDIVRDATPVPSRGVYAVWVLFAINMVGYMDRQILSLLVQPIKASLGLSDGQIGLMQGAAFVLAFCIGGIFLGRLVDRRNRRNLLIACVLIWSVSAAASGLAQNAWQLFVARMGVGAGEAALMPTAISMISDYFDAERRGKALGSYLTGTYVGVGLSLALVGLVLPFVATAASVLAVHGMPIEPWRLVMLSMLLPGVICCLLLSAVEEPPRTSLTATGSKLDWSGFRDWASNRRVFLPHHVGFAMATFGALAGGAWLPSVLIREHAFGAREAGLSYGAIVAIFGCASTYVGGVVGDIRSRRAGARGRMSGANYCFAIAAVGFMLIWLVPSTPAVFVGAVILTGSLGVILVIGLLSIADLSPPESRGQISSIYLIFTGLLGSAGGPAVVGYANDLFGRSGLPLSTMLGAIGMGACVLGFVLISVSLRRIPAATDRPA